MKSRTSSRGAGTVLRRISAAGLLLSTLAVGAVLTAAPAQGQVAACAAPTAPAEGAMAKNIDTTLGCDNPDGAATNPATGYFAINMPATTTTAGLIDYFQGGGQTFFGTYTLTFSNCAGGSATGGTYTLSDPASPGGGFTGQPGAVTADTPGGTVSCAYSVSYSGTPPAGATLTNRIQTADQSPMGASSATVQRFAAADIPEAPIAILLPAAGALAGGVLLVRRRRSQPLLAH